MKFRAFAPRRPGGWPHGASADQVQISRGCSGDGLVGLGGFCLVGVAFRAGPRTATAAWVGWSLDSSRGGDLVGGIAPPAYTVYGTLHRGRERVSFCEVGFVAFFFFFFFPCGMLTFPWRVAQTVSSYIIIPRPWRSEGKDFQWRGKHMGSRHSRRAST